MTKQVKLRRVSTWFCLIMLSCPATAFESCYTQTEQIMSASTGITELKTSYIEISKHDNDYAIQGLIWGGNFHICSIASPVEGEQAALKMRAQTKQLVFEFVQTQYDIDCRLEFEFKNETLVIKDENTHCSQYVFYCGAHVSLHQMRLVKTAENCTQLFPHQLNMEQQ